MIKAFDSTSSKTVEFSDIAAVRRYVRKNKSAQLSWDAGGGSSAFCWFDGSRPRHVTKLASGVSISG